MTNVPQRQAIRGADWTEVGYYKYTINSKKQLWFPNMLTAFLTFTTEVSGYVAAVEDVSSETQMEKWRVLHSSFKMFLRGIYLFSFLAGKPQQIILLFFFLKLMCANKKMSHLK